MYIPLDGIKINFSELKIGKITLIKMSKSIIDELTDNLEYLVRNNPYYRAKDKEDAIKSEKQNILKFKDKICAKFTLFAEKDIAIEQAFKECENSLDLLRFSSYFFYSRDYKVNIGLEGEINRFFHEIIAHKRNYTEYTFKGQLKGPLSNFEITDEKVETMRKIGIFKVSEILKRSKLTNFEETLLLGIHWFTNSISQREIENQFLSAMIVLEIFLTPGGYEPISNSIAESTARILVSGLKNRKELKKTIKKLYEKRSNIVHGRKNRMPKEEDIATLQNITADLIMWMIKKSHTFKTKKDLINHLEDRKLA